MVLICIILLFSGCSIPYIKTTNVSYQSNIETEYGDEFEIKFIEWSYPNFEAEISVKNKGKDIFNGGGFANYTELYDYEKDIKGNYSSVINSYKKDNIRAYLFTWGIIYSLDNGATFSGVAIYGYETEMRGNETFKQIYNNLKRKTGDGSVS